MYSRVLTVAGLAGAVLLSGCAQDLGGTIQSSATVASLPGFRFLNTPSEADVLAIYPQAAMARGITGEARVECRFSAAGGFEACVVLSESPPGHGFGQGALRVMTWYRWDPKAFPDMVGRSARQRVEFRLP